MSNFSKPHSFPTVTHIRSRARRYPYILQVTRIPPIDGPCEACNKGARYIIQFEANKDSLDVSTIQLCDAHEKLTRYGKWDQVFRDMNWKIEGK